MSLSAQVTFGTLEWRKEWSIPKLIPIFCLGHHLSLEQHSFAIVIPSNEGLSFHLSNSRVVIPFRNCLYHLTLLCLSTTNLLTPYSHSTFHSTFSLSIISLYFLSPFLHTTFSVQCLFLLSHYFH